MPRESRADRALSRVLRPFAKVEPSEAHRRRSGVLEQRILQGLEGMGIAIP